MLFRLREGLFCPQANNWEQNRISKTFSLVMSRRCERKEVPQKLLPTARACRRPSIQMTFPAEPHYKYNFIYRRGQHDAGLRQAICCTPFEKIQKTPLLLNCNVINESFDSLSMISLP
jgi:hypothetical protein